MASAGEVLVNVYGFKETLRPERVHKTNSDMSINQLTMESMDRRSRKKNYLGMKNFDTANLNYQSQSSYKSTQSRGGISQTGKSSRLK